MTLILKTGFSFINHEIEFRQETIKKGKALSVSHVIRVEEIRVNGISQEIKCSVIRQTSVNSPPYSVKLLLDSNRKVTSVSCTCVSQAGGKCKHVFALIHYINIDRSISKTNLEKEWGKPSDCQIAKDLYAKGLAVSDYFKVKTSKENITCSPYNLKYSDLINHPCALRAILREEEKSEGEKIVKAILNDCITFVVASCKEKDCSDCIKYIIEKTKNMILHFGQNLEEIEGKFLDFYRKEVLLSESAIINLCLRTTGQSNSQEWFNERFLRISASSKAHSIKSRKTRSIENLLKTLFDQSKPVGEAKKNFVYGRKNEDVAISECEKVFKTKVIKVGLVVLQSHPWLCASPDGIIIDGHTMKLLEIKCPITCEKKPIFYKISKKFNVPYLKKINNVDQLNPSHQYYTQCQIGMYVTGLLSCVFYVWSPCGSFFINVERNETYLKNVIPILENFYFKCYLKELYQRKEKEA